MDTDRDGDLHAGDGRCWVTRPPSSTSAGWTSSAAVAGSTSSAANRNAPLRESRRVTTDGGLTNNQRSLAQTLALIFGLAFLAVGVLGFIPGITTNLGDIDFAGKDSPSEFLGIFQVSILHNLVHLLFGIAGIALSRTRPSALMYLLYSGVIYVVLFAYGLFVGAGDDANFVPINNADDWLHLVLAVGLLGGWFISKGEEEMVSDRLVTPPPAA